MLGLTFGATIDLSLNYLYNNSYAVAGYDNSVIVLDNVNYSGYIWPQGRLIYNRGLLTGSEFYYSSPYYDTLRYNQLLNSLTACYGYPVESVTNGATMVTTWFGGNRGFITLRFEPLMDAAGRTLYYTMLSLGN